MDNDFAFRAEPGVFLLKQKLLNLQSKKYKTIGGKNQRLKKSYCLLKVKLLTLKKKLQIQKKRSFLNLNTLKSLSLVRNCFRRHSIDYINNVFEGFEELHGDNLKGDDPSIICGFGLLKGNSVCIIAQEKGRSLKTKINRSFGCPKPSGYRKALRTMLKAEVLGTPIVTIVDTPGAFPGIESEENNISGAISLNIREFFFIKVPIVTVIIGEGGSGGALGIGISDKIIMLEHSYFSVISPEGCSSILWKNNTKVEEASKALKPFSKNIKRFYIADYIVKEVLGSSRISLSNYDFISDRLNHVIINLKKINCVELLRRRFFKFRTIGKFNVA